ncbi:pilus assembly protein [Methylosinus sp. H3A]|uniref:TadE family protein n=1 Tax=Methylosinus sp. H3A TaxID=2785786 RepID=UPI0018C2B8AD|nr:TadE family protein [Methylosinus sp. H3A]MBG0808750.1 pilus assembly protein [Methylosinus sp. H3A]
MSGRGARRLDRRGSAAVEFALLTPVIILMIAGVAEFGRIYVVFSAVNKIAAQYAISWADCSDSPAGTCSTEMSLYTPSYALGNIAPQIKASGLTLQMFQVTMGATSPTVVYAYPTGSSLSTAQTNLIKATFSNGQSAVLVTATYAHSLAFFPKSTTALLGGLLTPSYSAVQLKS